MRIILDCEPQFAERALQLALKERKAIEHIGLRDGWGFWSSTDPEVSFWLCRTKTGLSVRARPSLERAR